MTDLPSRASGRHSEATAKKAKTVTTEAKEILKNKKRIIAVKVDDIFGNDAGAVVEVK